jgi:hypothetical protein
VRSRRFSAPVAMGLAIGGPPAVVLARYLIKSMPLVWLRWLVVGAVLYAAVMMLNSARRRVPMSGVDAACEAPGIAAHSSRVAE